MALTFEYTISGDTGVGALDEVLLALELQADTVLQTEPALSGIQVGLGGDSDRFDVDFAGNLSAPGVAALNDVVSNHDPANPQAFPPPPSPGSPGTITDGSILCMASAGIFGCIPPLGLPPSAWTEKGEMDDDVVVYTRTLYPSGTYDRIRLGIIKDGGSDRKIEVAFYADDGAAAPTLPVPTGAILATTGLLGTPGTKGVWHEVTLGADIVLANPTWLWSALVLDNKEKPRLLALKKMPELWYGYLFLTKEDLAAPLGALPGSFDSPDDSAIPYIGLCLKV